MVARKEIDFHAPIKTEFPGHPNYQGEVGVEIEVEGENLPRQIKSYWSLHKEGSLRGESAEYVLTKPAGRKYVGRYLDYLAKQLEKAKAECEMSVRTSVHVHVNMSTKTLVECYNFILCYLIVEDILTKHAGETRVGNIFCLRARDAEFLVDYLAKCAKVRRFKPDPEQMRYSSVNICAIEKFNSLEFRALRGTIDMDIIKNWISILLSLKDVALTYKDPTDILRDFSRMGPVKFMRKLLPNHFEALAGLAPDWENKLWDAARLVQEIAYATDWKRVKPKEQKRFFVVGNVPAPEPDFVYDEGIEG